MNIFDKELPISKYPSDFIPADAEVFIGIDKGSPDGDCIVKGFYDHKTGKYHIQEVTLHPK